MSEWISVDNRLPEQGHQVLIGFFSDMNDLSEENVGQNIDSFVGIGMISKFIHSDNGFSVRLSVGGMDNHCVILGIDATPTHWKYIDLPKSVRLAKS